MLNQDNLKTSSIKFSLLPEDKNKVYTRAEEEDISVSELARRAIFAYLNISPIKSEKETYSLKWRYASTQLSKSALIIYLLLQEQGNEILSPTFVEKLGFMNKSTASKGIKELREKGFLLGEKIIYKEEDK